jgi:peptidyl-prolyl cis-trans isomerase-like 4
MVRRILFCPLVPLSKPYAVSKDFLAQAGDPTATGTGGESIWSYISSSDDKKAATRYFTPEIVPKLKHTQKGTVSMAIAPSVNGEKGGCGSQFFITLGDNIDYLDGKHAVFGHVVEGLGTLDKLNDVFTDQDGRPFKDVRIRHVVILGMLASRWPPSAHASANRHSQMIHFPTHPD